MTDIASSKDGLSFPPSEYPDIAHKKRSPVDNFHQQSLKAWQPILKPSTVSAIFFIAGIFFLIVGSIFLAVVTSTRECTVQYEDPDLSCSDAAVCTKPLIVLMDKNNCVGNLNDNTLKAPIFLYYGLTSFYQNHRRYYSSRNEAQLRGEVITDPGDLVTCDPIITLVDGRILSPCGLAAWSVFNDTISIQSNGVDIPLDESMEAIAWPTDKDRFHNPDTQDPNIYEWLNPDIFPGKVENPHFVVWMRTAALPNFRKLYARIDQDLELPVQILISSRFPTAIYGGTKTIVVAETSWLGGRNVVIGASYVVVGFIGILCGTFFFVMNYRKPRIVGDVRYLNWKHGKNA
eukprot:GHVP01051208.1.p1 GENE.GHVP01051208.1~~GHVP01051208.1.p1  ORF type:complete len:346 (+),score=37.60 GHVP01051208.1:115-1152(+)